MHFNVERYRDEDVADESGTVHIPGIDVWSWKLIKADGEVIAVGPRSYDTEAEARSHIAQAKKSMKGAMRCKVVTVDDTGAA